MFNLKYKFKNLMFSGLATVFLLTVPIVEAQSPSITPTVVIPHRIISLSPNFTEIIYDIGAQNQLVGVTNFCKYPPEAQQKEKVGGWVNPNIEKIISLRPDLLLVPKFIGNGGDRLEKLHLPILVLNWATVADVMRLYDTIGEKLGRPREAQKAKAWLQGKLNRLRGLKPHQVPLSVLFIVDHTPGTLQQLYGVGSRNFIDELIQWTGGRNVLEDSPVEYPLVSKEQIVHRDPDVIITVLPPQTKPGEEKADLDSWKQLSSLKAVKRGHIYAFQGDDLMVPGPTMFHLANLLSNAFAKVRADHE